MGATFIFSFDCEGKWGVADLLGPAVHRSLTDAKLREAYRQLVDLLDRFETPATFAFVGLFAESASGVRGLQEPLDRMARLSTDYLAPALTDLRTGSQDGWHGPWAIDLVGSSKSKHEIAFHGVTHIPWDRMDDQLIDDEIALFRALTSPVHDSRTMVFPRNLEGHLDRCKSLGIVGHRRGLNRARIANLTDELNPLPRMQADGRAADGHVAIPAGYFVNWQYGPRRLIPRAWSKLRAKMLVERAARSGRTVHFWLHPENIAQAPRTLGRLEDILAVVRDARDRGIGKVNTQVDYCLERLPPPATKKPGGLRLAQPAPSQA